MPDPAPRPSRGGGARALDRETVDALHDFALTVTWDPETAPRAVTRGVNRAGRHAPLPQIYSEVRAVALMLAPDPSTVVVDLGADLPPGERGQDPVELLALGAAPALDPSDRAVLDLALRSGLEGSDLATALDVAPETVDTVVEDARSRADWRVRSYVLARLGTASCPRLAEALEGVTPHLDFVAERVDEHCADCSICDEHRTVLASPTGFMQTMPRRKAPPELHERLVSGEATEPDLEERARRRRRRLLGALSLVVVLVAAVVVALVSLGGEDDPEETEAVPEEALVSSNVGSVDFGTDETRASVTIDNSGEAAEPFRVEIVVPWLTVDPAEGELPAGGSVELTLTLDREAAPEGTGTTTATVVTESTAIEIEVMASVSRDPVIQSVSAGADQVSMAPCEGGTTTVQVVAEVVDDSGVDRVNLRWSGLPGPDGIVEGSTRMTPDGDRYEATLGPFDRPGPLTWAVHAADTSGNAVRSEAQTLVVSEVCDAPPPPPPDG